MILTPESLMSSAIAARWAGVADLRGERFLRFAVFFAGMGRSLAFEGMTDG